MNLKYMKVSLFEISYKKKLPFWLLFLYRIFILDISQFHKSEIQLLLVKMCILDINNLIVTSDICFISELLISKKHFQISEMNIVTSEN